MELSQLALRDDGSAAHSKSLIESTKKLLEVLQNKCQLEDGAFDEKLADYVFFPLSQILRRKQKYTDALSELTIRCLKILLEYGWKKVIALDLAKQLLILLTFVAGGVPGQATAPVPEELSSEAYGALAALFTDLRITPRGPASLVESGTIPALGHCVTVILDGIIDGPSATTQQEALKASAAVWRCVKDQQALSGFLPGTISALTKCLMPSAGSRRSYKTIISALRVLEQVLVTILSDIRTRSIRNEEDTAVAASTGSTEQKTLTKPWLKATTSQIKLALSNVIRLRTHESPEVRKSLSKLCLTILDECHDTLSESASMLVETSMTLNETDGEGNFGRKTTLMDLATIHTDLGDLIKSTVYNWVTSLPRVMQSNDETAKHIVLRQLSKAQGLLEGLNLDSSFLENALADSLRDSVTVTLELSPSRILLEENFDVNSQAAMTLASENTEVARFQPVILPQESQRQTRIDLVTLLGSFGTRQSQVQMASDMLEYIRGASGPSLLAAYWIAFQLLKSATAKNKDFDEFFTSSLTFSDDQEILNEELFSYSVSVLSDPLEENPDWQLQAVALEVIADTAQRMKAGFRTELVDTLYPIAQLLGSPNSNLRQHAITCLNIISRECGYISASALIIDNVDYMVNAVSLRLNTFDISPQAPQVLVMMIRLTGPSLLLYLDDVVGSIFAALDNFHGYPLLVESLFSVLGEIVEVGAKSTQLQIDDGKPAVNHRKNPPPFPSIDDIVKTGLKRKNRNPDFDPLTAGSFPQAPWKTAQALLDEAAAINTPSDDPTQDAPASDQPPPEPAPLPPTKTATLLTSITTSSQHHLTTPSPHLRTRLLSLIRTAALALSPNEDAFLPLLNDIWPVVVGRLYDDEPYVRLAAMGTVSVLCECAGDFMVGRVRVEWARLMAVARRARAESEGEKGGRGVFGEGRKAWEGVVGLLVRVVGWVSVGDVMFDEVLEVLGREVVGRAEVRDVLEGVNADAVWLALRRKEEKREVPVVEGYTFAPL